LILFVVLYSLSPWMRDRELIDAPSTYWGAAGFAAGSAIASTILAFGVIFLLRLVLAPMQMYWSKNEKIGTLEQKLQEDRARIEELETKLRAVEIEQNTIKPQPDWPIRELFFHIRSDLLDDATKHLCGLHPVPKTPS